MIPKNLLTSGTALFYIVVDAGLLPINAPAAVDRFPGCLSPWSAFSIDPGTRLAIPPNLGGLCGDFHVIDRRVWFRNRRAHFAHRLEVGNCPQRNRIAPWPRSAASAIRSEERSVG